MWGRRKDNNKPYLKTGSKRIIGENSKTSPTSDVHLKEKHKSDEQQFVAVIITPATKGEEYVNDLLNDLEIAKKGLKKEIKEGRGDSEAAKNYQEFIEGTEKILKDL